MDGDSQSLGIYRRLISLVYCIIGRKTKHSASYEMPIEENHSKSSIGRINKSNVHEGSEIVIEFKHRISSENTIRVPEKNASPLPLAASTNLENSNIRVLDRRAKDVNIRGSDQEEKDLKSKQQMRPVHRVMSDIDKKSESFIERRRKALNRNHSFDH